MYWHPGHPSLKPHSSESALRISVLATLFFISTSPGRRSTVRLTGMSNTLSLSSGDHGTARIPSIRSASHLSDSGTLLSKIESCMCKIFSQNSRCPFVHAVCAAASFRLCRCRTCSSDTQQPVTAGVKYRSKTFGTSAVGHTRSRTWLSSHHGRCAAYHNLSLSHLIASAPNSARQSVFSRLIS